MIYVICLIAYTVLLTVTQIVALGDLEIKCADIHGYYEYFSCYRGTKRLTAWKIGYSDVVCDEIQGYKWRPAWIVDHQHMERIKQGLTIANINDSSAYFTTSKRHGVGTTSLTENANGIEEFYHYDEGRLTYGPILAYDFAYSQRFKDPAFSTSAYTLDGVYKFDQYGRNISYGESYHYALNGRSGYLKDKFQDVYNIMCEYYEPIADSAVMIRLSASKKRWSLQGSTEWPGVKTLFECAVACRSISVCLSISSNGTTGCLLGWSISRTYADNILAPGAFIDDLTYNTYDHVDRTRWN